MFDYKQLPYEHRKYIRHKLIYYKIKYPTQNKQQKRSISNITIEHIHQLLIVLDKSNSIATVGVIKKIKEIIKC